MRVYRFEDLEVWKKSQDLAVELYTNLTTKDWGFKDQINRAVISISNNIAEGFNRRSKVEFRQFLYVSYSSCSEVRSMLYLTPRLNYMTKEKCEELLERSNEISKMIWGLIKTLPK